MWRFIIWMLVEAWPLCAFSSKNISCSFDLNCFGSKDMRSGMQPAYGNMKNSQRWEISRRSNWGDMRQIHGISLSLQALILDDTCRDATGALWAATQPLRCTSSFSNWRLYIWTYACLHISSYVCLYYSFATVLVTISVYFWLMLILYLCCHAKTCVFIHYILISLLSCKYQIHWGWNFWGTFLRAVQTNVLTTFLKISKSWLRT